MSCIYVKRVHFEDDDYGYIVSVFSVHVSKFFITFHTNSISSNLIPMIYLVTLAFLFNVDAH